MKPRKHPLSWLGILLIAALLAACGSPAAAPTATSVPPTATPVPPPPTPVPATPVPPTVEPTPVAETPAAAPTEPHGLRPDAPPYAIHGPHAVGVRSFSIQDGDHAIGAVVWYPALNPMNASEEITYTISATNPNVPSLWVKGMAIQDATPDTVRGPYPLVVFSPGLSGWSQENSYLLEHLASHGLVVISSDPRGETLERFWMGAATRLIDTNRLITFADELTAKGGELAGMIDTDHVAVSGHSSGGWTALTGGGAQLDWSWCTANPEIVAENDLSNCTQFVPHSNEIAALLGLDSAPTGLWPQIYDPRVDAVLALAPDGDIWGANFEGVSALKIPTLIMVGSRDTTTDPDLGAYPIYEHLGSATKGLIKFENGDHMIFGNQCRDMMWMVPDLFWLCSDSVWDMDRAHDLINHFATAFLLAELKGDADAAKALAPENVEFTGITYESAGYGAPLGATLDDATAAKIDAIVQTAMTDYPAPGFEMCVVKDGQVVYNKGFGMADVEGGRPMTTQSVSNQASISKSLTAMAVMQLVEQGKIDLDAPVTTYLPYFAMADPRFKDITVRMVLSHVSGLPDVPFPWDVPLDPAIDPLEQAVRSLSDQQLLSAPGEAWNYSGWGYALLGDMITKVNGEAFAGYMQQHLLQPMGMANSTFVMDEVNPDLGITRYISAEDGSALVTDTPFDDRDLPADGLWSNCEDMTKWAQFMLNKGELNGTRVLQPESIDAMWKSAAGTFWLDALGPWYGPYVGEYGLGWYVGEKSGHRLAGHAGASDGVNTHIQFAPDDGLAVIAMDNWLKPDPDWYPAGFATFDVMDLLLGLKPDDESAAQLDEATVTEIEAILGDQMQPNGVPGYAMCVVKDGDVVYNKGFGVAELGGDLPVTPQSVFTLASTTKSFTGVALMQLVEQGKVDLDASVTTYLPYFEMADPRYKDITVRMLASHTSGLTDEAVMATATEGEEPAAVNEALEWYVRSLSDDALTAAPGEIWQYASVNFSILGDLIGKVSGLPYDQYVTQNILEPLKMIHSTFDAAAIPPGALVGQHMSGEDAVVKAMPLTTASGKEMPAGGLYSTCEDMTRWMQVNLNRGELDGVRILKPESYDVIWKVEAPTGLDEFFGAWAGEYGLGWGVAEDSGHFLAGHPGGGEGQTIGFQLAPDDNLGVTVLANWGTATNYPAWMAAAGVTYALLGIDE